MVEKDVEGLKFIKSVEEYAGIERKWFIRVEAATDPKYGKYPWQRPIEEHIKLGVIPLDKPPGPTSHEVVAWIKKMLGLSKAGHGGTLDPKVTGVLPIALEEATKIIGLVMHTSKEYICVMQLHSEVSREKLERIIKMFVGEIYQRPPLRSSVKRAIRKKKIYRIDLLEYTGKYVLLRVESEAGTYMRKLCHDIGLLLGVEAHMRELRRIRTGPFREEKGLVRLQDLSEAIYQWREEGKEELLRKYILPVEYAVAHLPKIVILDSAVDAIAHGADLAIPGISMYEEFKRGELVAVFSLKGELVSIGIAQVDSLDIPKMEKGIVVKTRRVIMKPGIYPKMWKTNK